MYRILQSLERAPSAAAPGKEKAAQEAPPAADTSKGSHTELSDPTAAAESGEQAGLPTSSSASKLNKEEKEHKRMNPHKALLYKPSVNQLLVYLSTACRVPLLFHVFFHKVALTCMQDTHETGALFLYMSSDPQSAPSEVLACARPDQGYTTGIPTTHLVKGKPASGASPETTFVHSLHPGDLVPFTRRPLFVVVEGGAVESWQTFPKVFDAPVMILASPQQWSAKIKRNVSTLFLVDAMV